MTRIHRRAALSLGAATLAAPFASRAQAPARVTLQLNWFGSGDHAPLYLARKRGFYTEEGIDLTINRGTGSADTARRIEVKQADFGISDAPTVIAAVAKNADLVMLGVVFDKAANNAFFYKERNFRTPADLAGKKVALPPGDSHRIVWPAFARANGVDPASITMVNVRPEGKQAIVVSREVDLSFDLYSGYPLWERALGQGNVGHMLWADHGFQLYGHTYIAHRDTVRERGDLCRRFLRATYRGWAAAAADHGAAVDALVADAGAGLERGALLAAMPYVMELCVTERSREHGLGWILPQLMSSTLDITASGGTLERKPELASLFTNEFNSRIKPAA
ncbi:ABC transporter substrate-binding protein [Falsiroseomonas sp.]|uniref:ABC transporter substrate-binding protein n=1 Tax=Falsiroseomonas sp. TaxID=2870721 RepID=UPI003562EAFE